MQGKYLYIAIGVALGVSTMLFQYHFFTMLLIGVYITYLFFIRSRKLAYGCFIIVCVSALFAWIYDGNNKTTISPTETSFVGSVHTTPIIDGDQLRFVLLSNNEKLQVSYILKTEEEKEQYQFLKVGAYVKVDGNLEEPPSSRNDNQFNYQDYLYKQHIHYLLKGNNLSISNTTSNNPNYALLRWRQSQLHYIEENFSEETIPFIEALIYGDRRQFSPEVEDWYEKLGIVHLLAISGSHVTLLIVAGYYCLLRGGLTKEKATLLLLFLVPMYMVLAGGSPSVVRASLTGIIVLLAFFSSRKVLAIDMLSIVFMVMLFINPYFLGDVGFLLSFLTSITLIVSSAYLSSCPSILAPIIVTIIAQLSALPVTLFNFYETSPYSVLLNAIFVPFISFLILPLCIFSLLFYFFFPPIGMIFIWVLEQLIVCSNHILALFADIPFATIVFGKPSYLWIIVFYFLLLGLYIGVERKRNIKFWVIGLSALFLFQLVDTDSSIKVTFIDVGQGDCMLIQLSKEVYLMDTGGAFSFPKESWQEKKQVYDVGREVVVSYLKSQGISRIDKLILTHGDADHAGSASEIMKEIKVKEVVVGQKEEHSPLEIDVIQAAEKQGMKVTKVKAGDSWKADNHQFYILAPFGDEVDENERSIVLYTAIGEYKWLFTGDLGEEGEKRLVQHYPSLSAEILKVGHHGSKNSSSEEFLEKVNPKIAIIQAGKNNRYHHPHQEVIERLQGISILRTDEQGMITYKFLHGQGTFQAHLPYDGAKE